MIKPLYIEADDAFVGKKLNELIEALNKLEELFHNHFHESLDTHYHTTSPKIMRDGKVELT